jgi:hypothetical protein
MSVNKGPKIIWVGRTFKQTMRVQTTSDSGWWRGGSGGNRRCSNAHQVGEKISIHKKCGPSKENGHVIAQVIALKYKIGKQIPDKESAKSYLFERHSQSPAGLRFHFGSGTIQLHKNIK